MIFKQVTDAIQGKAPLRKRRSYKWPKVRKEHLRSHPACAVCGGTTKLEVHHIIPFHVDQTVELDSNNLITLCESRKTLNCHHVFGHLLDYKNYNKNVIEDCKIWNEKLKKNK